MPAAAVLFPVRARHLVLFRGDRGHGFPYLHRFPQRGPPPPILNEFQAPKLLGDREVCIDDVELVSLGLNGLDLIGMN